MDRGHKRDLYASYGMEFYWIADDNAQAIEMWRLTGGAYELLARPGSRMIATEPFPGLALTDIWP